MERDGRHIARANGHPAAPPVEGETLASDASCAMPTRQQRPEIPSAKVGPDLVSTIPTRRQPRSPSAPRELKSRTGYRPGGIAFVRVEVRDSAADALPEPERPRVSILRRRGAVIGPT